MAELQTITTFIQSHNPCTIDELLQGTQLPKRTLYRHLLYLIQINAIKRTRTYPGPSYYSLYSAPTNLPPSSRSTTPPSPPSSKPSAPTKTSDPPLVHLEVTNPVTYLKLWWQKVIGNEGINVSFAFKIKPLTAITLVVIIMTLGFSVGRLSILEKTPLVKYLPAPTPTPNPWRNTAFSGLVKQNDANQFYLVTSSAEAISLELPANVSLTKYINQRIFATGRYNHTTNVLVVTHATDLEVLPTRAALIPTLVHSPSPAPVSLTNIDE